MIYYIIAAICIGLIFSLGTLTVAALQLAHHILSAIEVILSATY